MGGRVGGSCVLGMAQLNQWVRPSSKCAFCTTLLKHAVTYSGAGQVQQGVIKGTVPQYLRLQVFHESVCPKTLSIPLGLFRIFSKICRDIRSSRCTTGVIDNGGNRKKSSIRKFLIILFGHLWVVELTYR
jgi:hypothetical protein